MAVLAKLQKNQEELDFENKSSNVLKEHDSVSSSSDSKSSKPSAEAAETVTSSLKQSPSSSSQSPQSQPQSVQNNKMKTIDEKALHEIQSVHPPSTSSSLRLPWLVKCWRKQGAVNWRNYPKPCVNLRRSSN